MLYLPPLASFSVLVLVLYILDGHLSNYVLFVLCVSRVAVCERSL
jgi:hypothetical protein